MSKPTRTAVLISGRGSNMHALVEATKANGFPAEIVGVISNKADAGGLSTASEAGLNTATISMKEHGDKLSADRAIMAQLAEWQVDLVCLAGFMRVLSPEFCKEWQGKIINIHPSLLPLYPGLDTHERALADEASEHGCTVHFVTAEMDGGPIIGQVAVPVEYGDSVSILTERVLKAEHKLYPWALEQVASGKITF